MHKRYQLWLLFTVAFLLAREGSSQSLSADTTVLAAAQQAQAVYRAALNERQHLFNGPEYVDATEPYMQGNPYFLSDKEQPGSIEYRGLSYADVPMQYNLLQNQPVLRDPKSPIKIRAIVGEVDGFTLGGHRFIRLSANSVSGTDLEPGFYDVLLDNGVKLLARRSKKVVTWSEQRMMQGKFVETAKYYVQQGGKYYPTNSKAAVLQAFPAHKKALQQYSREKKLQFKQNNKEASILQLVTYGSTLPDKQP